MPRRVVAFISTAIVALLLVVFLPNLYSGGSSGTNDSGAPVPPESTRTQVSPEPATSETSPGTNDGTTIIGVSAQVLTGHLETGGASFKVTNTGDLAFTYGGGFHLLRYEDAAWVQLEPHTDMIVAAIAYSLEPGETAYIYANWEPYYGALESGLYRYVNDDIVAEFELTADSRPGPGLIVPPADYNEELIRISEAGEIIMTLDPVTDLGRLKLRVENTTDTPYLYGAEYVLFMEIPGQENSDAPLRERWAYVAFLPNTGFDQVGYELTAKAQVEEECITTASSVQGLTVC